MSVVFGVAPSFIESGANPARDFCVDLLFFSFFRFSAFPPLKSEPAKLVPVFRVTAEDNFIVKSWYERKIFSLAFSFLFPKLYE